MVKVIKYLVVVLGAAHLIVQLFFIVPTLVGRNDTDRDLFIYQKAADKIALSLPLYNIQRQKEYTPMSAPSRGYLYPPPLAAVLSPFAALSPKAFAAGWLTVLILAFWCSVVALSYLATGRIDAHGVLGWSVVLALTPGVYFGIILGQVDILLLALFTIGLATQREIMCWAVAMIVKVFFIWPLLVLGIRRIKKPKQWLVGLIPMGILLVIGGWLAGWNSYLVWLIEILPTLSQGSFDTGNVSLSFAVLRLFQWLGWWIYEGGQVTGIAHLWLTFASCAAPLTAYYFTRKAEARIQCSSVVVAAVLFAPVCWTTYLALLLPLIALCYRLMISRKCDAVC